jgi:NADPH-dependent ferric siderophore reductase
MVGDESALPAIAASLEYIPVGVPVVALAEVDGPADELPLRSPGELTLRWLHRDADPGADDLLLRAVEKLDFPDGRVHAFVHGEAVANRALRKHLLGDRRLPREVMSVSPYWRRTYTDESWRQIKRDWLHQVEADV